MKKIDAMAGFVLRLLFASGTGANRTRRAGVLAGVAMALIPQMMRAQTTVPADFKVLDDFTKGKVKIDATSGTTIKSQDHPEIVGGTRTISLELGTAANNPYGQPVQVQVLTDPGNGVPPAFLWSVGYGVLPRIDLYYGEGPSPMHLNLAGYDRFRIVFGGLTNLLNFNLEALQGSNNEGTTCGINLAPYPAPFTVDFPFSAYVLNGAPLDFSDISVFDIIFQGGTNLAITGFYAIPAGVSTNGPAGSPDGPATFICARP